MSSHTDYTPTLRFERTFALSPDGQFLAYADDSQGTFNLTIKPIAGGPSRWLTSFTDKAVRRIAWHPSAGSVALTADSGGDEQTQIYLLDIEAGGIQPLTESPGVQHKISDGSAISPDGRLLAYAANDRDRTKQDVLVRDLKTGAVRRVCRAATGNMSAGFWSPDGTRISVHENIDLESNHAVHLVDPGGGPVRQLTSSDSEATYWLGPWLPDGSGFVVRSNLGREFTVLGIMDAATGHLEWLDTPKWDIEAAGLSTDGRVLAWSVNVDGISQLRARDLTSGADIATPELPAGVVFDLTVNSDGSSVVMRLGTAGIPTNFAIVDLDRCTLRWLTDAKPATADPATFVEPTLIRYAARDGREVPAYLYRPVGVTGRLGVVLSIHGGPDYQERPTYMYDGLYQYLLSQGVAVLAPNYRGSPGYGMSNVRLIHRDWGGGDLSDYAGAVDYLRRLEWVDPERIGLLGGSYGGFAVLSCLSRLPEVGWAAAVVWSGPSNLVTLAKLAPPTWRARVLTMIGDPETDEEFLLSRSPVTYADRIEAPLFIVQGANDPRVPKSESDQIVERLRDRGVAVRYDVYPDEGHGFVRTKNQAKRNSDTAEFLLTHLRPA